jgi:UDP-N-acetylglucosamine 2-epimerase (non-hydrolysing)
MKTVMTIVGTRPEIIKLSRVIAELEKFTNHVLVHTGQNYDYELNEVFLMKWELKSPTSS